MARAAPIQTSVNSGELAPRMASRVDFDRYANGAATARNVVLLPTGGFTTMPGTRFVAEVADSSKATMLLPFKASEAEAYVVEMGENYFRFYKRQARLAAANIGATISNGTFASNITDWDDQSEGSTAAIAHSATGGGRLALTPSGGEAAIAQQDVATTTTGVEHVLAFTIEGDLGASLSVGVGSASLDDDLFPETVMGLGNHVISFTPAASPFYVWFKNTIDDPVETVYVDDVSLLDNTPLQLTHDYTEAQLFDIRYQQANDILYLYHPDKRRRRLERRGDRTWSIVDVYDQDGPWGDRNPGIDLAEKNLIQNPDFEDGIKSWTDKSNTSGSFEWSEASKIIVLQRGVNAGEYGAIEQAVSTGIAISTEFVLHFRILGGGGASGETTLLIGTSSGGTQILSATEYVPGWHSITFSTSAATIYVGFRSPDDADTNGAIGGVYLYRSNAHLMELSGTEGSVTCTASGHAPFKSTDVGRSIRFTWPGKEPAWGIITAFTDTATVTVRLRRQAPYADIPTEDWQLGEWSDTTGWPTIGAFFQSRAVVAGTADKPRTMWFSQSFDIENFRPDSFESLVNEVQDDDALTFTLQSENNDPIRWIKGKRRMLVGSGGIWVSNTQGPSITATDVGFEPHAEVVSASAADALSIEDAMVMIEAGGRRLFDVGFKYENETFTAAELSILAEHVGRVAIEAMEHQRRPLSTIWTYRSDGRLAPLAYSRAQDIIGWTHCSLSAGKVPVPNAAQTGAISDVAIVEDIAIIPGADDATQVYPSGERDEVWFLVKRRIGSATQRYVEVMEGFFTAPVRQDYDTEALWEAAVKDAQKHAFYVHSGITYDGSATTSITGLDHLEGCEVAVLADGRIHPNRTVSSGGITLAYSASVVQVGLPYDWEVETLKLPFGTQTGSGVGKTKSISDLGLALLDSGPINMRLVSYQETEGRVEWEPRELTFERDGLDMDEAIPLFTGEITRSMEGPDRGDVRCLLYGSSPLPVTVLAIVPEMEGSERSG